MRKKEPQLSKPYLESRNTFDCLSPVQVHGETFLAFALSKLDLAARLPYSLRIMLENLLRHEGAGNVSRAQIETLCSWGPSSAAVLEVPFYPSRVLLQDFTGIPCLVDLAAMRDAVHALGKDPGIVNPVVQTDLVVDHSLVVDVYGRSDALRLNKEREGKRNQERYRFLRWAQESFSNLRVVPPDTGIVHQVNLEHLAPVICQDNALLYPDTVLGADSHTTMINGLGILGWGIGGIEAQAVMLGEPLSLYIPPIVGVRLVGDLREGMTATDLVLTIAERLRRHGVVGKFVEFYGPGLGAVPVATRATIANMSPEYGSTCALFPVDEETLRYLRLTGRDQRRLGLIEAYAKLQGWWHDPNQAPVYNETVQVDLTEVVPCVAGPRRPYDRVPLSELRNSYRNALKESEPGHSEARGSFGVGENCLSEGPEREHPPVSRQNGGGAAARPPAYGMRDGAVIVAAITSCTNTSNPLVMVQAGLLAKKAVARGLETKPWVKTSLAPGSRVVLEYLRKGNLTSYLDRLGFNAVGFGCTTCIGNSGPLLPDVSRRISEGDLVTAAVLSGNRNFENRVHPEAKLAYLASPPLVIAYALAGTVDINLVDEPLGVDKEGSPVYLRDIWPPMKEVQEVVECGIDSDMFVRAYSDVFAGDMYWQSLADPADLTFQWAPGSTYIRRPPYFERVTGPQEALKDVIGARVLVKLGDSVTTDHIYPASRIEPDSPAGRYLGESGVAEVEMSSYGFRRGNHEVMVRGMFANPSLDNQLLDGVKGGFTTHLPSRTVTTVYEAAQAYQADGTPLVILAGKNYGVGSSRDGAAKGTALLGVKAVLAESYERIHRSNLIGMGVLPLEYLPGESATTLGLTGAETVDIYGIGGEAHIPPRVTVSADGKEFTVLVRIDTELETQYFQHGGILQYLLQSLLDRCPSESESSQG